MRKGCVFIRVKQSELLEDVRPKSEVQSAGFLFGSSTGLGSKVKACENYLR
jgi:hypothetical protein